MQKATKQILYNNNMANQKIIRRIFSNTLKKLLCFSWSTYGIEEDEDPIKYKIKEEIPWEEEILLSEQEIEEDISLEEEDLLQMSYEDLEEETSSEEEEIKEEILLSEQEMEEDISLSKQEIEEEILFSEQEIEEDISLEEEDLLQMSYEDLEEETSSEEEERKKYKIIELNHTGRFRKIFTVQRQECVLKQIQILISEQTKKIQYYEPAMVKYEQCVIGPVRVFLDRLDMKLNKDVRMLMLRERCLITNRLETNNSILNLGQITLSQFEIELASEEAFFEEQKQNLEQLHISVDREIQQLEENRAIVAIYQQKLDKLKILSNEVKKELLQIEKLMNQKKLNVRRLNRVGKIRYRTGKLFQWLIEEKDIKKKKNEKREYYPKKT